MGSNPAATAAQIPTSFGHELRACLRCRLVKTYDQRVWCPFFKMDEDHEVVVDCTTPNFTGIISVMDPSRSWAARWLRIGKFVPGCYTLAVSEELPDEYQGPLNVRTGPDCRTPVRKKGFPTFGRNVCESAGRVIQRLKSSGKDAEGNG